MAHNGGQDQPTEEFRTRCDLTRPDEPTTTVVTAVAAVSGKAPDDLDLLGETIETEALNDLFTSMNGTSGTDGHVLFHFESHTVIVRSTGDIIIRSGDDEF